MFHCFKPAIPCKLHLEFFILHYLKLSIVVSQGQSDSVAIVSAAVWFVSSGELILPHVLMGVNRQGLLVMWSLNIVFSLVALDGEMRTRSDYTSVLCSCVSGLFW